MADRSAPPLAGSADLRPLSTSELIDRGFALYRQNFAGLFLLALLAQIAPLAISEAVIATIKVIPTQGQLMERPSTDLTRAGIVLAIWIVGQVITFGFAVVITAYLSEAYLGGMPSIKTAFLRLRSRLGNSMLTSLLSIFLLGLTLLFPLIAAAAIYLYVLFHPPGDFPGMALFMMASLVILVASIAPVLIVFMRLMLTAPAVALENLSGWKAVKRSAALVRFDPGLGFLYWGEMRLSLLLLPLVAIELLSMSLTSLPVTLYELKELLRHGSLGQITAPPESVQILTQILVVLSGSLLLPLYLIATTLFYFDVRIRREGFDLELMAAKVKANP